MLFSSPTEQALDHWISPSTWARAERKWLAVDDEIAHALSLVKPYPPEKMEGYDVSTLVNNPRNDSPQCIQRIEGYAAIMEKYKGFLIYANATPSPPYASRCWYAHGIILKSRPKAPPWKWREFKTTVLLSR